MATHGLKMSDTGSVILREAQSCDTDCTKIMTTRVIVKDSDLVNSSV